MITYPSISGLSHVPFGEPCLAFHKYDGSCLRFFWDRTKGWHRFGTRYRWFDANNPGFGSAVGLFHKHYADGIVRVLRSHKEYRNVTELVAFCEFFGPSTFAGLHREDEPKEIVLFDVYLPDRELILPKDFVAHFGHLRIPEVVYQGPFTREFIDDVRAGKYPVKEGVVAKGAIERRRRKGKVEHKLWMAKVKTATWLDELRRRAGDSEDLRQQLEENTREQTLGPPDTETMEQHEPQ
jgi:hypothetical protein